MKSLIASQTSGLLQRFRFDPFWEAQRVGISKTPYEPYGDVRDFDEAHEVDEQLVISGGDAAELLEFGKEALDAVAFLIEMGVVGARVFAISLGRDDDGGAGLINPLAQVVGVISLVREDGAGIEAIDKLMSQNDIAALAGRANQPDRQPQAFRRGMDFRGQSPARPAQTLGIRPPFSLRAPAAC